MKKYKYKKSFTMNGKRVYVYADTFAELARKIAAKQTELERKADRESNITLAAWSETCIELYKSNQADSTRQKFEARVKKSILEPLGAFPVKAITPEQVQLVMNLQAGKSRTQINEVFYALRFLFSHAVLHGIIVKDPTERLAKPKKKKSESRRALTDIEREAFLACATQERKYYGFLLSYYCGCRPSEAAACTGADIIERDGLHLLHIRGTKTASADRFVPIPGNLLPLIENTPKTENIALYPSARYTDDGNRHHLWNGLIYKMNLQAGAETYRNKIITPVIGTDLVPYCLRHDYCTRLARAGVDIRTAQKLMGHASITMTANIYTHVEQSDLAAAAILIEAGNSRGNAPENH